MTLNIKTLSDTLSPAGFSVQQDNKVLFHIEEVPSNLFARILGYTKLRMLCPVEIEMINLITSGRYRISKRPSLFMSSYKFELGHSLIATFEPKKIGWRWLRLASLLTLEIRDNYRKRIGSVSFKNPFIIGYQYGEVKDDKENIVAQFEWKGFSFWKGYRECELFITRDDEKWPLISIVSAIIRGLYLQQR